MTSSSDKNRDAPDRRVDEERRTPRQSLRDWIRGDDRAVVGVVGEFVTGLILVLAFGVVLVGISGVWPPMVAVVSDSMEPNVGQGDLVYVMDTDRTPPEAAPSYDGESTGVVPADVAAGTGHTSLGGPGDVIVFRPDGEFRTTPIVHRAMFWVDEGEDWYDRADPEYVGDADDCSELLNCPAPNAGFITKGDNDRTNSRYDQIDGVTAPVHPNWILGTAEARVPYLGYVRILLGWQAHSPGAFDSGDWYLRADEGVDSSASHAMHPQPDSHVHVREPALAA